MLNKDIKTNEEAFSPPKSVDSSSSETDTEKCQTPNGTSIPALISFEEGEQVNSVVHVAEAKNANVNYADVKVSDVNGAEVMQSDSNTVKVVQVSNCELIMQLANNPQICVRQGKISDGNTLETQTSEAKVAEVESSEANETKVKNSETNEGEEKNFEANGADTNNSEEHIVEVKNSITEKAEETNTSEVIVANVKSFGANAAEIIVSDVNALEVKTSDTNATQTPVMSENINKGGNENSGEIVSENAQENITEHPVSKDAVSEPFIEISDDGSWDMKPPQELDPASLVKQPTSSEAGPRTEGVPHDQNTAPSQETKCAPTPVPAPRVVSRPPAVTPEADASVKVQDHASILDAVADLCDGLKTMDNAKAEEPPEQSRATAGGQHAPPPPPPFRFGKFPPKDVVYDSILENKNKTKSYWEQRMLCVADGECAPKVVDAVAKSPAVAKIAMELREMREREEELRRARLSLNDSCSEYGSEDSMVSPPGYSHQRTDSMSSGHSSGSDFGRRRVTVKPLDEPDSESETPVYKRTQKETPIEREIRLAREREEELRREKGLPPLNATSTPKSDFRFIHKTLNSNEHQNTHPPQPATTRIQQEIDEAVQRERELKEANGIIVSDDDIPLKTPGTVTSSTGERENDQNSMSPPINLSDSLNGGESFTQTVSTKRPQLSSPVHSNSTFASPTQRFSAGGGQKGLMQRFYASHGRMKVVTPPRNVTPVVVSPSVSPVHSQPTVQRKIVDISTSNDSQDSDEEAVRTPVRRGYQSAEEKIQAEMQEMQKREEELRLLRAKLFAQSQPNLLSIGSIEEEDIQHVNGEREKSSLQSAQSIPNLLDSDDSLDMSQDPASQKFQRNSPRKRSALIAEWESRIQKNAEH